MEWLLKPAGSLVAKVAETVFGSLARRIYGDRELASKFRLDIAGIYENGPAILRLKAVEPMDHVEVLTIHIETDGDWFLHPMGAKTHDGQQFADPARTMSPEIAVNLSVTELMKSQGPYTDGSFSFLAGFQVITPSQDGQTTRNFGRFLQSSQGNSITLSNAIQVAVTLCSITDNRRETFIRLKTQPIAQAKVIPARAP